jgi:hypothetical protein
MKNMRSFSFFSKIAFCIASILVITLNACAVSSCWSISRPIKNSWDDLAIRISGNNLVWVTNPGGGKSEILSYDGNTVTQITYNVLDEYYPDVSGSNIVWSDSDGQIYLYNGTAKTKITSDPLFSSYFSVIPRISGTNIVWQCQYSLSEVDYEILFYNGSTVTRLTNNDFDDIAPQISGQNIAWECYDGSDYEIFYHDETGTRQVTNNSTDDALGGVSGTRVAYCRDGEIYMYNAQTNMNVRLTKNAIYEYLPVISGSNMAWVGYQETAQEIFYFDGFNIIQLTNNSYADYAPQICGSNVVWQGDVNGFSQIFYWDGQTITQVTNTAYRNTDPQISETTIAWIAQIPGVGPEVMTAKRCSFLKQGDLNGDAVVNLKDLAILASNWLVDCAALSNPCVPDNI